MALDLHEIDRVLDAIACSHLEDEVSELIGLRLALHHPDSAAALFASPERLNRLVSYVFTRRFGWSDADAPALSGNDGRVKKELNEVTDAVIGLLRERPINQDLVAALSACVAQSASKPVVREQTLRHFFAWLKHQLSLDPSYAPKLHASFAGVKRLVLGAVCDVWSAIRKASCGGLAALAPYLSDEELEQLYADLEQICLQQDSGTSWQKTDGAVAALCVLLKSFSVVVAAAAGSLPAAGASNATLAAESSAAAAAVEGAGVFSADTGRVADSPAAFTLRRGVHEYAQLPPFMSRRLRPVLYTLLAHPQLTVREFAIKAFSAFLHRCLAEETLHTLPEVVARLLDSRRPLPPSAAAVHDEASFGTVFAAHVSSVEHRSPPNAAADWLEAYEAEALLAVCAVLLKLPPLSHAATGLLSLRHWPLYFSCLVHYLAHPASTVRQVASAALRQLLHVHPRVVVARLLLQTCAAGWPLRVSPSGASAPDVLGALGSLLREFLVGGYPGEQQHQLPSADGGVIVQLQAPAELDGREFCFASADAAVPRWEWQEGRLLTYELLLKLVLADHAHWLLPNGAGVRRLSSTLTPPISPSAAAAPATPTGDAGEGVDALPGVAWASPRSGGPQLRRAQSEVTARAHGSPLRQVASVQLDNYSGFGGASLLEGLANPDDVLVRAIDQRGALLEARDDRAVSHWRLAPLDRIVRHLLVQVITCFGEPPCWELVRMADQVLPLLAEFTLWLDPALLQQFWSAVLLGPSGNAASKAELLTALGSVKAVVQKADLWRDRQCKLPDEAWGPGATRVHVARRLAQLDEQLLTLELFKRLDQLAATGGAAGSSKVRLLSTEILMMLVARYSHRMSGESRAALIAVVVANLAGDVPSGGSPLPDTTRLPGLESRQGRSLHHSLLRATYPLLCDFLKCCQLDQMFLVLPKLVDLVVIDDDPDIQRSLLQAVLQVLQYAVDLKSPLPTRDGGVATAATWHVSMLLPQGMLAQASDYSVNRLLALLSSKTLETSIVVCLLDVLFAFCQLWYDLRYLPPICRLIASSMNQETLAQMVSVKQEHTARLHILSNDIRQSSSPDLARSTDSTDTTAWVGTLAAAGGRDRDADESDSSSDWDSDSEDGDVSLSRNLEHWAAFLNKLSAEFGESGDSGPVASGFKLWLPSHLRGKGIPTDSKTPATASTAATGTATGCPQRVSFQSKLMGLPPNERAAVAWLQSGSHARVKNGLLKTA